MQLVPLHDPPPRAALPVPGHPAAKHAVPWRAPALSGRPAGGREGGGVPAKRARCCVGPSAHVWLLLPLLREGCCKGGGGRRRHGGTAACMHAVCSPLSAVGRVPTVARLSTPTRHASPDWQEELVSEGDTVNELFVVVSGQLTSYRVSSLFSQEVGGHPGDRRQQCGRPRGQGPGPVRGSARAVVHPLPAHASFINLPHFQEPPGSLGPWPMSAFFLSFFTQAVVDMPSSTCSLKRTSLLSPRVSCAHLQIPCLLALVRTPSSTCLASRCAVAALASCKRATSLEPFPSSPAQSRWRWVGRAGRGCVAAAKAGVRGTACCVSLFCVSCATEHRLHAVPTPHLCAIISFARPC